jgi:hypothetical protein
MSIRFPCALGRLSAMIATVATMTAPALAQWSSDPAHNLVIADRSGEQVQPKLAATSDGGFYVSWFDNASGGYDVYLQRLDAAGVEQWPHNGVLVADRDFSSTQDYGLGVDSEGNALLAFRFPDDDGISQVVAAKVSPEGKLLWDAPGIFVSSGPEEAFSPRIVGTTSGNSVAAWSSGDGSLRAQRIDTDGVPQWGDGVTLSPVAGLFLIAHLGAAEDGNVILSWQAQASFQDRQYWAQKLAGADGASLWTPDHVKVMDNAAGVMQLGNFPTFVEDGSGGAVFGWYHISGLAGVVRVQHLLADGDLKFAQNGVTVSTDTSRPRYAPSTAYDADNDDIYVAWRETNVDQNQIGVYAQRIDSSGARGFGDTGREILPLSGVDKNQLTALSMNGGVMVAWVEGTSPSPMPIRATHLDAAGDAVWPEPVVSIKTSATAGARLAGDLGTQGFAALVWQDGDVGESDIKAQNIDENGQLGIDDETIFTDGFEN